MEASSNSTKQGWTSPELTVYGDVAKITADDAAFISECGNAGGTGVTKEGMGSDDTFSQDGGLSCMGIARF